MPRPAVPRYAEIAADLRARILGEELAPHTLLPSERELGEQLGVSRMTARQALTVLAHEGYVYRRPPRGTFVAEQRHVFRIGSFSREVERGGRVPAAVVLRAEETAADAETAAALGLEEGAPVHVVHRLRSADREPLALETSAFPVALTPGLLDHELTGSLWTLLADAYALVVTTARATLASVVLDDESCRRLDALAATPGMRLVRTAHDADGRCVEFARDLYRSDRAVFEVEADVTR
ncbi:GntR family transcriptional regulator [Nocardioides zeae]|uniref:GntR family transcriptional regulator n=1 Tax=Nocardioides imazamoxiresistens TaxID=3231893 RepID=A0ABU3PUW1_9ACTN|nr:GntR family transcriptional regulator [Nocardioides zeae]MDT9593017.1 GntR family transcriptional regulator [Nocardioides zeae]